MRAASLYAFALIHLLTVCVPRLQNLHLSLSIQDTFLPLCTPFFFVQNITLTRETWKIFWERPAIKNTLQKYLDNTCCSFWRSMGTVYMRGCAPLSRQIRYVWILWGRRSERRQLCASPPLTSATSMTLLRIAIFKREPGLPPADKAVIIPHLHDKCVCLCTHLCMYVWVLKRTLAAVGRGFLSFISAQKMGRGPVFNAESGSLSLCSSSECSSLATLCRRALKWSPGLWRCGTVMTLGLCVCACVRLHLCGIPSGSPPQHLHVKCSERVALRKRLFII